MLFVRSLYFSFIVNMSFISFLFFFSFLLLLLHLMTFYYYFVLSPLFGAFVWTSVSIIRARIIDLQVRRPIIRCCADSGISSFFHGKIESVCVCVWRSLLFNFSSFRFYSFSAEKNKLLTLPSYLVLNVRKLEISCENTLISHHIWISCVSCEQRAVHNAVCACRKWEWTRDDEHWILCTPQHTQCALIIIIKNKILNNIVRAKYFNESRVHFGDTFCSLKSVFIYMFLAAFGCFAKC